MSGVFAEFERSIIQERVRAGLARAKSEGKNRHQDHAGERNRYDKGREDAWSRCGPVARISRAKHRPLGGEPHVGWILAHNNVSPNALRGFRAFWVPRDRKKWVVCRCGWQPELGEHYRPRRV